VLLIEVIGGGSVASWKLKCYLWRCKCLLLAVRVPLIGGDSVASWWLECHLLKLLAVTVLLLGS